MKRAGRRGKYDRLLAGTPVLTPEGSALRPHVYHLYVVQVPDRANSRRRSTPQTSRM